MSKPIQSELARLDALITRCEALAEQSPGIYRLRVGLLAQLGIVVVLAVVVGSVLLSALLIFAIAGLSITINELVTYGANLIGLDYHGHHYVHSGAPTSTMRTRPRLRWPAATIPPRP